MNRLADETSPYLRQHRDNPVDWYAWGPDAFAAAQERNVPILLSVGYSACHWCHVMAHECFEDTEVATKMNELFVNVKVDREERPDVDALYMDAVQAMTGRGGWPMTVFLTPDREPFYGGTYFPKDAFLKLLDAINGPEGIFTTRKADVAKNIDQLVKAISRSAELKAGTDLPDIEQLNNAVQGLGKAFDPEWGGFGKAPKFPSSFNLELMLRAYMSNGADAAKDIITTTLGKALGGALGGCTSGRKEVIEWLRQKSRPYLFSNSVPMMICGATLEVLRILREDPGPLKTLARNQQRIRKGLQDLGFDVDDVDSAIIPVHFRGHKKDAILAQGMAKDLLEAGIYCIGFSFPVVPVGQARIRLQASAAHTDEHVDRLLGAFAEVGRKHGVID